MPRKSKGRPPHDDVLTPAEWQTLHAVQHGMSNREIARRRGISVDGVKFHLDNIKSKLGVDSKRSLRDWFQAPKTSALMQQDQHMNITKLSSIGQISRSVRDIATAQRWYTEVLGLSHLYTFGKLAFFDCNGTRLFLTENETAGSESILYFAVPDIVSAHRELQSRGAHFISVPHMIHKHQDGTEEWMAFFNDPEGRPLAIMSQVSK